jgi:hypothetical protein
MAKYAPSLDIYRPVLNVIEDDFERLRSELQARMTRSELGKAALRVVRFSKPKDVVIQPVSSRELIGFYKEHGLRFGRTEAGALREHLTTEYPASAETPLPASSYPPTFYDIENKRGATTFVALGADTIQTMHDRLQIQRAVHSLHGLPETYDAIQENWEDNEYFTRLIVATIRDAQPEQIIGEFEAVFAEQPEIFPAELELGPLRIEPFGVKL